MKKWPEGDRLISAEEAIGGILDHLQSGAAYQGYDFTCEAGATCLPPDEQFSVENLAEAAEMGRSRIEVALLVAFQLGLCQGVRLERGRTQLQVETLRILRGLKKTNGGDAGGSQG